MQVDGVGGGCECKESVAARTCLFLHAHTLTHTTSEAATAEPAAITLHLPKDGDSTAGAHIRTCTRSVLHAVQFLVASPLADQSKQNKPYVSRDSHLAPPPRVGACNKRTLTCTTATAQLPAPRDLRSLSTSSSPSGACAKLPLETCTVGALQLPAGLAC